MYGHNKKKYFPPTLSSAAVALLLASSLYLLLTESFHSPTEGFAVPTGISQVCLN